MTVIGRRRVVVAGSGNAGMSAAIAAAEAGADVTVLEKAGPAEAGGNTWYTAGAYRFAHDGLGDVLDLVALPDPRHDRTDLPPYPRDAFAADLDRLTDGRRDPELAAVLIDGSRDAVAWLRDHGVPFELMYHRQAYEVDGRFRFWGGLALGVAGGGKALVDIQQRIAARVGVELVFSTAAAELVVGDDGAVCGVVDGDGRTWKADAVVLAAGGFQADPDRRARHLGERWRNAKVRGTRHNTGDGVDLALAVGAAPAGDWTTCHAVAWDAGAPATGDRQLTNRLTKQSYPLGLVVNARGERFFDEGADFRNYTYARLGAAIIEQPGAVAYQLFDARTASMLREDEYDVPGIERHEAPDLRALARAAGIDPGGLERTVASFNAGVVARGFDPTIRDGSRTVGVEPPKSNWAQPLDRPPYVAVAVTCGITFTFGGVHVDRDARALDADGRPIPGLHAVGEMLGGLYAGNYPGGSGLTAGTVFGRRAGRFAAAPAVALTLDPEQEETP